MISGRIVSGQILWRGRNLMALGQDPGPAFGEILARCYEAQLEGKFTTVEAGIKYAEKILKNL